jgi:2-iminobutanoate/2-iminopropanoate deaminase
VNTKLQIQTQGCVFQLPSAAGRLSVNQRLIGALGCCSRCPFNTVGIIGQQKDDGSLPSDNVAEPCEAMMTNLESLLGELDLNMSNLLRTTIYLTDYEDFEAINAVYAKHLQQQYPVRKTIQVAALPLAISAVSE